MGCCLFASMLAGAPRVAFLIYWLFRPGRVNATFDTIFWPIVGVLFLPWVTLMYVFVAPNGVVGFDWLWLGIALAIDIGSYVGGGTANQRR